MSSKIYHDYIEKLRETKQCVRCEKNPIYNFKRQICRSCYNKQYLAERQLESGTTICQCGCGEQIPAKTRNLFIARFKHGHVLRHTEENFKRNAANTDDNTYLKNHDY